MTITITRENDLLKITKGQASYYLADPVNVLVNDDFIEIYSNNNIGGEDKILVNFADISDKLNATNGSEYLTAAIAAGLFRNAGTTALTTGFLDYNNSAASFETVADTWTDIPNDTLGAFTNLNYLPTGVSDLIDKSNGYLDFTQLKLGDQIIVRNDITVTPSINGTLLELRYLLGSGAGEYPLQVLAERLDVGSGIGYQRVTTFPIYMGDENTRLGPGRLQIRTSSATEVANAGSYINVIRQ